MEEIAQQNPQSQSQSQSQQEFQLVFEVGGELHLTVATNKQHMNGKYKKIYQNGNIYEGELKCGEPNGFGKLQLKVNEEQSGNKGIFIGQFEDGKLNGECEVVWEEGSTYKGHAKNGKRSGLGTYIFSNGMKEVGLYDNNNLVEGKIFRKNGSLMCELSVANEGYPLYQGKCFRENGAQFDGQFKFRFDDYTEKTIVLCRGRMTLPNGDCYEGEGFVDQQPHGRGTYTWADGSKFVGEFEYGKPRIN